MADGGDGLVLVNGPRESVQGPRARGLFQGAARIVYKQRGRIGSIRPIASELRAHKGSWVYCIDLGIPSAPLAALWKKRRGKKARLVFEIGDPARPLLENQDRPAYEVAIAGQLDRSLPAYADRLVFRGSYLADYFASIAPKGVLPPWLWLPDGADMSVFSPRRDDPAVRELRRRHELEGRFVVGIVGSLHHNPFFNLFYGWELAEALACLPADAARSVVGVVVGDGPGRPALEEVKQRLGLGDRLRLMGRVPHAEVPLWMNVFDVGLSTQTDDPVGWGRTTAKLPEYLGCGTVVVATDVGEAHRWLAPSGQTLPYQGMRDETYPARLASRLSALTGTDLESLRRQNRELALRLFDYNVLRPQVAAFLAGEPVSSPVPE